MGFLFSWNTNKKYTPEINTKQLFKDAEIVHNWSYILLLLAYVHYAIMSYSVWNLDTHTQTQSE